MQASLSVDEAVLVSILSDPEDWSTFGVEIDEIMSMTLNLQSFLFLFKKLLSAPKVFESMNTWILVSSFFFGYLEHFKYLLLVVEEVLLLMDLV